MRLMHGDAELHSAHETTRADYIQLLCDDRVCGLYPVHMWYCEHSEFTRRNFPWKWEARS